MTPIPRTDIDVFGLCLGGNVFGWTADREASFAVLDAYAAAGGNFIDTADVYMAGAPGNSGGESETIIGEWLAARTGMRDAIVIATKVGKLPGLDNLRAETIRKAADDSLRRLGVDQIDLYYAHFDDTETPLAETLGAFGELIDAGKVRAIGASNYSGARLTEALETAEREGLPRYVALQPHYNLMERDYESDQQAVCEREDVACFPFYGLARGFLTGKYRKLADIVGRPRESGLKKFFEGDRGTRVLAALDEVAERRKMLPAEVAVAWVMSAPGITAPIASATSVAQLDEVLSAAHRQLDATDRAILDRA